MTSFPEDSVQFHVAPWWEEDAGKAVERGRLAWAYVPYFHVMPRHLAATGRVDPQAHDAARFRLDDLRASKEYSEDELPVAALSLKPNEVVLANKGKRRPVLVLENWWKTPQQPHGAAKQPYASTVLVAPYYGVDQGGGRAGWRADLVQEIRRLEWPHFMWDCLPVSGAKQSVLRFDQIHPLGRHHEAMSPTRWRLAPPAMQIVLDQATWLLNGKLDPGSDLGVVRAMFEEWL